jgi:putative sigma-54 modulation protein
VRVEQEGIMEMKFTGRGTTLTDGLREHAQAKISDALKVFDIQPTSIDVVLRVTATKEDMYAAIDEAARMVSRKMRKYKTRVVDRKKRVQTPVAPDSDLGKLVLEDEETIEEDEELVRSKYIEYTKYTEEDALVQADLLGHDFFVFTDMVTGNVHVIYHRKNGGYGILKPDTEE